MASKVGYRFLGCSFPLFSDVLLYLPTWAYRKPTHHVALSVWVKPSKMRLAAVVMAKACFMVLTSPFLAGMLKQSYRSETTWRPIHYEVKVRWPWRFSLKSFIEYPLECNPADQQFGSRQSSTHKVGTSKVRPKKDTGYKDPGKVGVQIICKDLPILAVVWVGRVGMTRNSTCTCREGEKTIHVSPVMCNRSKQESGSPLNLWRL